MNENQPDLSNEALAELERALEGGERVDLAEVNDEQSEMLRCFSFVDTYTRPIRQALNCGDEIVPILSDYGELEEIGRGGMGVVYRGLHLKTQRVDAIKLIRPDRLALNSPEGVKQIQDRFQKEFQLAARIAHENIVPVYQVGEIENQTWFSMQYVNGASLRELSRNKSLLTEEIVHHLERIARAVATMHQHGILHGDIKPQNILVERSRQRPLITDFGLADATDGLDVISGVHGTIAYMAPEMATAALNDSQEELATIRTTAADIYSLGVTLWSSLTGLSPCFEKQTPREQLESISRGHLRVQHESRDIPHELMNAILKCVALDPSDRYETATQFADDLTMWIERPRWNRYFPKLRNLLCFVVAPVLVMSGLLAWWLISKSVAEVWIWSTIFGGYFPLFGSFQLSQQKTRIAHSAQRELWSVWLGHCIGSISCAASLRIACAHDATQALLMFYPCWAAISAVVFFAKSGNFWTMYRWIGTFWGGLAVAIALLPTVGPIIFGVSAGLTCAIIAWGDDAFVPNEFDLSQSE